MKNPRIKQALDNTLSRLPMEELNAGALLAMAEGGKKVKKKRSVATALLAVLLALTLTAAALLTVQEIGRQVAQNQKKQGAFAHWTLEQKATLIRGLIDSGHLTPTLDTETLLSGNLSEQEAQAAADRIMEAYTGRSAEQLNFLGIMRVPMGPSENWSHEDKAWYSRLMRDVGLEGEGITFFSRPSGRLSEADAVAIARKAVVEGYGVEEAVLADYMVSVSFEIPEEVTDGQAYWHVDFAAPDEMLENERLFLLRPVYVHPDTGELLHPIEKQGDPGARYRLPDSPVSRAIGKLSKEAEGLPFRLWPLALKARYSAEVAPLVRERVDSGHLTDLMVGARLDTATIARASYTYGLPDDRAVPQAQAFAAAQKRLGERYGLALTDFDRYRESIVYYDITAADRPVWKFVFNAGAVDWLVLTDEQTERLTDTCYKAVVDARTGEVVSVERFAFQPSGTTLETDKLWY